MSIIPPAPGEPRRPHGPRDSGDAWVIAETGEKYWGRYGAAGLLAVDPARGVLLQHRVGWSHFGGTWGLPGGALHEGESALVGALREAQEEAGVPDGAVRARFARVLDLKIWSYTTVVADVAEPFDAVISDPESLALEWVPIDEVEQRPLHPGLAAAWPTLRELLMVHPTIVVDAANVMGSVPNGWWKDRAGAAERLQARLSAWASGGVPSSELESVRGSANMSEAGSAVVSKLGLDAVRWYPTVTMVVEGAARAMADADDGAIHERDGFRRESGVRIVRAEGHGDDAIIDEADRHAAGGARVVVITSDRELRGRAEQRGMRTQSAGWLVKQLDEFGA